MYTTRHFYKEELLLLISILKKNPFNRFYGRVKQPLERTNPSNVFFFTLFFGSVQCVALVLFTT